MADDEIMKSKPPESDWKYDENGRVSSRTLAEMIISSLYYAKPPVITDKDYDRAVDITEEEINVTEILGKEHREMKQEVKKNSQQEASEGHPEAGRPRA